MADSPALLLATRSADKAREIRDILAPITRTRIITLADAGIEPATAEDAIEAFDTFIANARAKAAYFSGIAGMPTVADDSGICVDALNGAPGVRSRRFAAAPALDGNALDQANNEHLLLLLSAVSPERRSAHYVCTAALHQPGGARCAAVGIRSGTILDAPRGRHGFGYDPLFLDPETGLSFAELDPVLKNRTSHRARAFRALAAHL